jgi:acyl carrier protein
MDDIVSKLRQFISETYLKNVRQVAEDEALISGGVIDSFGLVDLTTYLELEFGVTLDASELSAENADTVLQLASLVQANR